MTILKPAQLKKLGDTQLQEAIKEAAIASQSADARTAFNGQGYGVRLATEQVRRAQKNLIGTIALLK